jgi:hypothetical protein
VSGPAGSPASGVHLPWAQVPGPVRTWADGLGAGCIGTRDLQGGFSPGTVTILEFTDGPDVFVKAVGSSLNPDSPGMHRREAVIAAVLPDSPLWPRLLDTYDDGDWVALAFSAIPGRLPACPWTDPELRAVTGALERMHDELTPSPWAGIESVANQRQSTFNGWRRLAAMPALPAALDPWSRRNLERLAALEEGWPDAAAGETLLHGDIRSDNVLLHADGVVFVDWPHASIGHPALDVVCWAPSVVLEGGPDPEELLALHRHSRQAETEAITVQVAAVAGFLTERSLQPPPPGLPTLRAFQGAQGEIARGWLQRRTGW